MQVKNGIAVAQLASSRLDLPVRRRIIIKFVPSMHSACEYYNDRIVSIRMRETVAG